jgi:hypothetical protein
LFLVDLQIQRTGRWAPKTKPIALSLVILFFITIVVAVAVVSLTHKRTPPGDGGEKKETVVTLNIHVKPTVRVARDALSMNLFIKERDGNEALDLLRRQEPHVTVYLTEFYEDNVGHIVDALRVISREMREDDICTFHTTNDVGATGSYVLWSMENSACLQRLSDLVVNATCEFAVPNQPIPGWVINIQDPIVREEKEEYVRKYGSPNVFHQFQPQYEGKRRGIHHPVIRHLLMSIL